MNVECPARASPAVSEPDYSFSLNPLTMQKIFLPLLLCVAISASAEQASYSYTTQNEPVTNYGFSKAETYDVAILINDHSLSGTKITSLSVPVPGSENVTNPKVWISSDLILKKTGGKYENTPDIAQYEATISDGILSCTLPEAYTISAPVYVGYSITTTVGTGDSGRPIAVKGTPDEHGLYLHSSKTKLKWASASTAANGVSAMTLTLDGSFSPNSASLRTISPLYASTEKETSTTLRLVNHGPTPVNSIEYTLAGFDTPTTLTLPSPLQGAVGAWRDVAISLPIFAQTGNQTLSISVTKVNGVANTDLAPNTETSVKVLPFIPVARPLVEEYTGLWCGYCPRGYVALETMKEREPERFISLAYHSGDAMTMPNTDSNNYPEGLPEAYINQGVSLNPSAIYTEWYKFAQVMPCADISAEIAWTDDTQSAIKVTSTTRFAEDSARTRYAISYVLVADGLTDPSWKQSNYFSGQAQTDEMPGYWGRIFCEGPEYIRGLIYNDVVLMQLYPEGYEGSVPEMYTAGQRLTHSTILNLSDINDGDISIVQDKANLRVVAILLDKSTGRPVNSCTSLYTDGRQMTSDVAAPSHDIHSEQWYDLQGHLLPSPQRGLNIHIIRYTDGHTKTEKIML